MELITAPGISTTIPAKIINDIPFPIPRSLICSPNHIRNIVPATIVVIFLMWLGEQITQRGIGNGISLIIFAGIVAEIPRALVTTFELGRTGAVSTFMILAIFVLLILTIL
jgi:preprotein translocase subunit SecY